MVNKLEELKEQLFTNLGDYPELSGFFRVHLENRVKRDNWLDSSLVHIIIERRDNISLISKLIECVRDHDELLYDSLKYSLNGNEKKYDLQLEDLLAELNAVKWISDNFQGKIEKIARSDSKTPDFLIRDENVIFEVKNMRAPDDLFCSISTKIENNNLIYPEKYNNKLFHIDISSHSIKDLCKDDITHIINFVDQIDKSVKNNEQTIAYQYLSETRSTEIKLSCSWRKYNEFHVMGTFGPQGICFSDTNRNYQYLIPLLNKTWNVTLNAIEQLLSYDKTAAQKKYVLLNWQKTPDFLIDSSMKKKYDLSVEKIREIIKTIDTNLFLEII